MMTRADKARQFRAAGLLAAQGATDAQALTMKSMYPLWRVDTAYGGEKQPKIVRRMVNGRERLCRCEEPHTSQAGWEPENYHAGWTVINEANAGTVDDPIPAERGMKFVYGLCYYDSEDKQLYRCERTGEAAGGKVKLHYMPHQLVGNYFEVVE